MNHKSILMLIASFFVCGLLSSVISSKLYLLFYPELFYTCVFAVLVIVCIVFFCSEDRAAKKHKRPSFVKVIDQHMFISKKEPVTLRQRKNLFMRVSIIALLGFFRKK